MTDRRLRVLILSPGLPLPTWGSGTRIYQLARQLATRHDVTVLTYADPSETSALTPLRQFCCAVHVVPSPAKGPVGRRFRQLRLAVSRAPFHARELYSTRMQGAIDAQLRGQPFDIVQLESSQMCCFELPTDAHVVLDEHNIEYELIQRMGNGERSLLRRAHQSLEERKVRQLECWWWRQVDGVAVPSAREEVIVGRAAPGTTTMVVPNSVDLEFFTPGVGPVEQDSLLFTGLLSYRPNLDAARFLVDDLLPRIQRLRPGVTLTIVGPGRAADLDQLRRPGVRVTGWVTDVRPYIDAAAVLVTPLRIGGGTRLKVLEGLAMGKPIVSTAVGCEGLDVDDRHHLLVADAPAAFARAVVELLSDPDLGRRLGRAGRALARSTYSWEGSARSLEDLYAEIAASAPSRGFNRAPLQGASHGV